MTNEPGQVGSAPAPKLQEVEGMPLGLAQAVAEAETNLLMMPGKQIAPVAIMETGPGQPPRAFDVPAHVRGRAIVGGMTRILEEERGTSIRFEFMCGPPGRDDLSVILVTPDELWIATAKPRKSGGFKRYDVQYSRANSPD